MLKQSCLSAVLVGAWLLAPSAHADTPDADCAARSTASLDALARGDFVGARHDFNITVGRALDETKLKQAWAQIRSQAGAYQDHGQPQRKSVHGAEVVVTPLRFAKATLNFVVACDASSEISGFRFMPSDPPAQAVSSPVTSLSQADGIRVEPLAVRSPFGPLQGVLSLPTGNGPFPVLLLVSGSGPNDRDETLGPNKPFRDIAQGMAAMGIATFRYDKRTYAYGAQMVGKAITIDQEVTDDALTALHALSKQAQIDPRRMFVLGHSLGALMAPRIGARYPRLAGLILLASPTRFGIDTVLRQMRYIEHLKGTPAAEVDKELAPLIHARDALARADPAKPPQGSFFHAPASYWLSLHDYDAVNVAKTLSMPMLVLQGGGDYQVTPKADFIQWQQAFAHSDRVRLKEYPGLSHVFMPAGRPPSPADYGKPGHVDGQVIADIAAWVKAQPARY